MCHRVFLNKIIKQKIKMNNNLNKSMEANIAAGRNPLWADEILIPSDSSASEECSSDCECDFCYDPKRDEYGSLEEFIEGHLTQDDDEYVPMEIDSLSNEDHEWIYDDLPEYPYFLEEWSAPVVDNVTNDPQPPIAPPQPAQPQPAQHVFNVWNNSWMTAAELWEFQRSLQTQRAGSKRGRDETVAEYMHLPHPPHKKRRFDDDQ